LIYQNIFIYQKEYKIFLSSIIILHADNEYRFTDKAV